MNTIHIEFKKLAFDLSEKQFLSFVKEILDIEGTEREDVINK